MEKKLIKLSGSERTKLYAIFSEIPLDIEGSNLSPTAWIPSETDKKFMDDISFEMAVKEGEERDRKVLFKNVLLSWDTCDCGGGFGCAHGDWVYEIRIINEDKYHILELDDFNVSVFNEGRLSSIPKNNVSVYDFYRMCEIVGIELELSDYAVSLIS